MKTALVIIAHAGAAPTVREFEPYWRKLGLPLIAAMPAGESWPGLTPHKEWRVGESTRLGAGCVVRFMKVCYACAAAGEFQKFVVAEYDTLNLVSTLPDHNEAAISCAALEDKTVSPLGPFLSPWIATRPLLFQLATALEYALTNPLPEKVAEWAGGYLDRWIGAAVLQSGLPFHPIQDSLPWPWDGMQPANGIASGRFKWLHGYKRLEEIPCLKKTA